MINRRRLFGYALLGTASTVIAPRLVLANDSPANPFKSPFAGGLYYTMDKPGRWAGKQGGHTPTFERSGAKIEITTGHPMDGFVHYIIKHVILDEHFAFVGETMFDPAKDAPISEHDIGSLKNVVYAVSFCNKHDAWLNALEL
jgi:superoxide reductase